MTSRNRQNKSGIARGEKERRKATPHVLASTDPREEISPLRVDLLRANTEELHNSTRSSDQIAYFFLAVALAVLIGLGLLCLVLLRA